MMRVWSSIYDAELAPNFENRECHHGPVHMTNRMFQIANILWVSWESFRFCFFVWSCFVIASQVVRADLDKKLNLQGGTGKTGAQTHGAVERMELRWLSFDSSPSSARRPQWKVPVPERMSWRLSPSSHKEAPAGEKSEHDSKLENWSLSTAKSVEPAPQAVQKWNGEPSVKARSRSWPVAMLTVDCFANAQVLSIKKMEVFFTTNKLVKLNKDLQQATNLSASRFQRPPLHIIDGSYILVLDSQKRKISELSIDSANPWSLGPAACSFQAVDDYQKQTDA